MEYKKRSGLKRITAVIIAVIFGLALLLWGAAALLNNAAEAKTAERVSGENNVIKLSGEIPGAQPDNTGIVAKYLTISQNNNIEILVNYLSPVNKEKDVLTFDIKIDTHSVDLAKYKDLTKYIELQTDAGITINDGFEWDLESGESHHIGGILKINNDIDGKPIVDSNTKSFKLVFKNIGDTGAREHVYEGDKLN